MKKLLLNLFLAAGCWVQGAIVIDGRLDEPEWQAAKEYGNFKSLKSSVKKSAPAQTSFKIIPGKDRIYIGIKCLEPKMDKLRELAARPVSSGIWENDGLEIFLTPTGHAPGEFYQFLVCYDGKSWTNYWMESGNIRPDPYFPEWYHKVYSGPDFWSAEIEIPLSAFYMTPQQLWKTEWALNIGRKRNPVRERTTWAPVNTSYFEPERFGKLGNFPMRRPEDYVYIKSAKADIRSLENGKPVGELSVNVNLWKGGEYELQGRKFKLANGVHTLKVPFVFEKEGRNQVEIALKRVKDGRIFKRWYPVNAKYEPLKLRLTWPQYRNNFYPGQDCSHIDGEIESSTGKEILLSVSGPGIKPQSIRLKSGEKSFSFKTAGFDYGTAVIKAETAGICREFKVRRLTPSKTRMAWVENGNLVVMDPGESKGRAILPRRLYADGYLGGKAFRERYLADKDLHQEKIAASSPSIEPLRLVKGIESKYGIYDAKPPKELFDKIEKIIEKNKKRNFVYYYLYDEPECRNISPVFIKYIYDFVAERDPYHLMMMASRGCGIYIDCCDWFETHPYVSPWMNDGKRAYDREFNTMGRYLDEISLSGRKDKVIGFMPTVFSYRFFNSLSVYPNFREIVCHTWAGMIHGGKSIWPYAYMDMGDRPDLYEGIRYIFSSFDALQDYMLFAKRSVLFRNNNCEVVMYELGKEKMFAAVNFTTEKQKISIPGHSGKYKEFRGTRSFSGLDFTLEPQEVIVGITEKKDQGLPTYKEVQEKIDRMEAERKAMPNLLIGHTDDIQVTASKPIRFWYKLFDGVRDVYAFNDAWGKCRFVEFSFTRFVPVFSSLSLYGDGIENAVVKIRKAGEWLVLKPAKVEKGKYMLKYRFDQEYRTVKLRIEFPQSKVELYEIELWNDKSEAKETPIPVAEKPAEEPAPAKPKKVKTVWQLDGSNAQFAKKHSTKAWFGAETHTEAAADGGFIITGKSSNRYIKLLPKHWIELDLVKYRRLPGQKYFNWGFYFHRGPGKIAGNVSTFQEGLYTINLPDVTKRLEGAMALYCYGSSLHFKYIRLTPEPENYLCATVENNASMIRPGMKITVTLKLKEPCEDVTCTMTRDVGQGPWPFHINGKNTVELKPVNGDSKLWRAEIEVKKYPMTRPKDTPKRSVMLRANVLGGKLNVPLITYIPAGFKTVSENQGEKGK